MKLRIIGIALLTVFIGSAALANDYVNGYYRNNGTYVAPHYRTQADSNPYNNYSTQGNTNPYTGQQGYVNPYNNYNTPSQGFYKTMQPGYAPARRYGY